MTYCSNKLILIIDDSADNQALLSTICISKGHRVHCACNGQEALSLLCELNVLPDLILLDARMPIMDGYQFRLEQKMNSRIMDIPVIVMSGDNDIDMDEKMHHPQGILIKPLAIDSIVSSLTTYLN